MVFRCVCKELQKWNVTTRSDLIITNYQHYTWHSSFLFIPVPKYAVRVLNERCYRAVSTQHREKGLD